LGSCGHICIDGFERTSTRNLTTDDHTLTQHSTTTGTRPAASPRVIFIMNDTSESEPKYQYDDDDDDDDEEEEDEEEEEEEEPDDDEDEDKDAGSFDEEPEDQDSDDEKDDFEDEPAPARKAAALAQRSSPPAAAPEDRGVLKRKAGQRTTRRSSGLEEASDFESPAFSRQRSGKEAPPRSSSSRSSRSSLAKDKRLKTLDAASSGGDEPTRAAAALADEGGGGGGDRPPETATPVVPPAAAFTPGYHPDLGFDPTLCNGGGDDGDEGGGGGSAVKKKKKGAVSSALKAKMRGQDPRSKILAAMYKRNRPGNVGTVEAFTGYRIPKGIVQATLEELVKSGELCANDGHVKVFWFNQV